MVQLARLKARMDDYDHAELDDLIAPLFDKVSKTSPMPVVTLCGIGNTAAVQRARERV